jgi:hypothetical protein
LGAAVAAVLWAGCTGPVAVEDPLGTLGLPQASARQHLGAIEALDADPQDPAYLEALQGMMWRSGYTVSAREAAFVRLERYDEDGLKKTLRQQLPRLAARAWQERLCELIAEREWVHLSPALVSSWSRRIGFVDDLDRREYQALVRLYGAENVIDVVFEIMVESNKAYQQGLRSRCWELLHRLGYRDRLQRLLAEQDLDPDDAMLVDLQAAAVEIGIIPWTREEILWVRKLREPEYVEFWSQAAAVVQGLPEQRRRELELRDLPILVAASIHDPPLPNASKQELYDRVAAHVHASRLHVDPRRFEGFPGTYAQRLQEHRKVLTWGDLAAMLMAVRAMEVPQVRAHLFDYAERDRQDRSCEYGGVIILDHRGRFEILEFPPRFRRRDNEFIASQQMLDAAYAAVFHFHNHAQRHRNDRYAGPGIGDLNYADNMRANCLVFTFVNSETLNVDFYRHGRVIVDLGEVARP